MRKPLKLNLGCGEEKIPGYVNIDVEPSCKPDLVHDFANKTLPYKDRTIDEVVMFHVIEHISKPRHRLILNEIWRVLRSGGLMILAYPEFTKCVDNWLSNKQGKRDFWEHTLYGRQLYPSDYHVCIMHTPTFVGFLKNLGFIQLVSKPEPPPNEFNTIVSGYKGPRPLSYEDLIKQDMQNFVVERA